MIFEFFFSLKKGNLEHGKVILASFSALFKMVYVACIFLTMNMSGHLGSIGALFQRNRNFHKIGSELRNSSP